jgi:hypothetical protein
MQRALLWVMGSYSQVFRIAIWPVDSLSSIRGPAIQQLRRVSLPEDCPMATVACPTCGLPRAEDLFDVAPCPVCGHDGAFPVVDESHSAGRLQPLGTPSEQDRPLAISDRGASNSRITVGLLVGFVLGGATGAAGVLGWQALPVRAGGGNPVAMVDVDSSGKDETGSSLASPIELAAAPMPREVTASSWPLTAEPMPAVPATPAAPAAPPNDAVPPKEPAVAGPPPQAAPPNPFRPAAPAAMQIDNPNGTNDAIVGPGRTLVLRGQVKTLRVPGLEGGAVLDCSDLEAQEIIVSGKIDGASTLWLNAPNGRVTFRAKVVGKSRVGIAAPGGTVVFANPGGLRGDGAAIDGGSAVDVKSRAAHFHGLIAGTGTRVSVTLTAGGSLLFTELEGPSRLEYSKADPDDSEPTVTSGRIAPPAVIKKIED